MAVLFLRARLPAPATAGPRRLRADVLEGMRLLWSQRAARAMMLWGAILNFAMGYVLISITLRLVRAGVHPAAIGAIDAIAAGAGILGAAVASRHAQRLPTGATTMITGLVLTAVVVPMAWTTDVRVIGALLAIGTFLLPANNAGIGAYLSFITAEEMQGRLNSAAGFVSSGLTPLAPVVAGALLATIGGVAGTLVGAALVAGSLVPLMLEPSVRRLGRQGSGVFLDCPVCHVGPQWSRDSLGDVVSSCPRGSQAIGGDRGPKGCDLIHLPFTAQATQAGNTPEPCLGRPAEWAPTA